MNPFCGWKVIFEEARKRNLRNFLKIYPVPKN